MSGFSLNQGHWSLQKEYLYCLEKDWRVFSSFMGKGKVLCLGIPFQSGTIVINLSRTCDVPLKKHFSLVPSCLFESTLSAMTAQLPHLDFTLYTKKHQIEQNIPKPSKSFMFYVLFYHFLCKRSMKSQAQNCSLPLCKNKGLSKPIQNISDCTIFLYYLPFAALNVA